MDINDVIYIDDTYFQMIDNSEPVFCFRYHLALSYNKNNEEKLLDDLKCAFRKHGVRYYDPEYDDFFSDYESDPLNFRCSQQDVFKNLKKDELVSYINDVCEVLKNYNVIIFRSKDSRNFIERDTPTFSSFCKEYDASIYAVFAKYYFDYLVGSGKQDEVMMNIICNEERLNEQLQDFDHLLCTDSKKYYTFHLVLDFFYIASNLLLKLQNKRKPKEHEAALLALLKENYKAVKFDRYARVRDASNEIVKNLLKKKED